MRPTMRRWLLVTVVLGSTAWAGESAPPAPPPVETAAVSPTPAAPPPSPPAEAPIDEVRALQIENSLLRRLALLERLRAMEQSAQTIQGEAAKESATVERLTRDAAMATGLDPDEVALDLEKRRFVPKSASGARPAAPPGTAP